MRQISAIFIENFKTKMWEENFCPSSLKIYGLRSSYFAYFGGFYGFESFDFAYFRSNISETLDSKELMGKREGTTTHEEKEREKTSSVRTSTWR